MWKNTCALSRNSVIAYEIYYVRYIYIDGEVVLNINERVLKMAPVVMPRLKWPSFHFCRVSCAKIVQLRNKGIQYVMLLYSA